MSVRVVAAIHCRNEYCRGAARARGRIRYGTSEQGYYGWGIACGSANAGSAEITRSGQKIIFVVAVKIVPIHPLQKLKKFLFKIAGLLFVALAFLGAFLPVLPTTPFLLLALWFFSRSSPGWRHWLLNNKLFGSYIRDFHEGRGIPRRVKFYSIVLLWAFIGYSAIFAVPYAWISVLLFIIAAGVTVHILRFETKKGR